MSAHDSTVAVLMRVAGRGEDEIREGPEKGAPLSRPEEGRNRRDWARYASRAAAYAFGPTGTREADRISWMEAWLIKVEHLGPAAAQDSPQVDPELHLAGTVQAGGGFKEAVALAEAGNTAAGSPLWDLANTAGLSVAHFAARAGTLPLGFGEWSLSDKNGTSVAHVAAIYGHLPAEFDGWQISTNDGATVAHIVADTGHLPDGFGLWDPADNQGVTVARTAEATGHPPVGFDRWEPTDNEGRTVAHVAAASDNSLGNVPAGDPGWGIQTAEGITVAEIVAKHGNLPERTSDWQDLLPPPPAGPQGARKPRRRLR